ncbi:MAG: FecR domain-containing protein, partial [Lachnospiraceae bacterium]|nr:FecR domain-containing protein [Lachnospiraceae bacterium]
SLLAMTVMTAGLWYMGASAAASEDGTSVTKTDSAATIRLMETEGTVSVSDSVGSRVDLTERMRLYSGNHVQTQARSYAMMSLDDAKAVKLDALSKSEIRKNGRKLQVLLEEGNLFFSVDQPLEEEESYHIRTSTMVMGIRGTCGIVNEISATHTRVAILEGEVECIVSNPATGVEKSIVVHAGEVADFVVFPPEEVEEPEETSQILMDPLTVENVEGFALVEICETEGLAEQILEASGLDFTGITTEQAREQLAAEQARLDDALVTIDQAIAQQNSNILVEPVWPGSDAATDASTAASEEEEEEEEDTAEAGAASGSTGATSNAATGSSKATSNAAAGSNAASSKSAAGSNAAASKSAATGSSAGTSASTGSSSSTGSSRSATQATTSAAEESSTASTASTDSTEEDEGTGHRIIVDSGITGGTVKPEKKRAPYDSEVKITVTPETGKRLTKLTCQSNAVQSGYEVFYFDILNSGGTATYTMTMGWDEDVLIKAVFE